VCNAQRDLVELSRAHQQAVVEQRLAKQVGPHRTFAEGDYVVVSYPGRGPTKLTPRWRGPLIVVAVKGSLFSCQDLLSLKVTDYHASRLKLYDMALTPDPVSVAAADIDEWKVEAIIDHVGNGKKDWQFRVRWEGYDQADDSWLPYSEVRDLEALDVYAKSHPGLRL
jgi:hypothetical protein